MFPSAIKKFAMHVLGALQGTPERAASHLEAISNYADSILGPSAQHLHEVYSPGLHIDLIHYAPVAGRDFHYLVTSGMSDCPMSDGGIAIPEPLMEVVLALPPHWDMSERGFQDPATYEPVRLLKLLARYPYTNETYFEKFHTVMIGDEPSVSPMQAVMLAPPVLAPEFREPLELPNEGRIQFMAMYLLHQDELDMKLAGNLDRLQERFAEAEVTELYDLARPSVAD
jgi:hypothetical protein